MLPLTLTLTLTRPDNNKDATVWRICILRLEVKGARSSWEALLDASTRFPISVLKLTIAIKCIYAELRVWNVQTDRQTMCTCVLGHDVEGAWSSRESILNWCRCRVPPPCWHYRRHCYPSPYKNYQNPMAWRGHNKDTIKTHLHLLIRWERQTDRWTDTRRILIDRQTQTQTLRVTSVVIGRILCTASIYQE